MVGGSKINIISEHWSIPLQEGLEYFMEVLKYFNFLIIISIILFILYEIQQLISEIDS